MPADRASKEDKPSDATPIDRLSEERRMIAEADADIRDGRTIGGPELDAWLVAWRNGGAVTASPEGSPSKRAR